MLRQDRTSLKRTVFGAPPATSLLLLAALVPSLSFATDIRCDRAASLALPAERLHVSVVDLAAVPDNGEAELGGDMRDATAPVLPDLSSRTRSLAILREIFGEPVTADDLDVTKPPRLDPAPGRGASPERGSPAVDTSEKRIAPAGVNADDPRSASERDARLPGVSEEESARYRREMYRTDI